MKGFSVPLLKKVEYNDILTNDIDHDAKSVYDLLKHRLSRRLKRIYELHGFAISEEYEDTIDDFFSSSSYMATLRNEVDAMLVT